MKHQKKHNEMEDHMCILCNQQFSIGFFPAFAVPSCQVQYVPEHQDCSRAGFFS